MIVALSEDSLVDPNTINGRELRATVETARMLGCRIHPIPLDFDVCETAEKALAYLPDFGPPVAGIRAGYIPAVDRYTAIYDAAAAKGVRLDRDRSQRRTVRGLESRHHIGALEQAQRHIDWRSRAAARLNTDIHDRQQNKARH